MFLDENFMNFKITRFNNSIPKKVKDIRTLVSIGVSENAATIQKIRRCIHNIEISNKTTNEYFIRVGSSDINLNEIDSKQLYVILLEGKNEIREWEGQWESLLQNVNIDWSKVWNNIHLKIHNPYVQSAIWEMVHLNFWSGYKAGEVCNLCGEIESNSAHITTSCSILKNIISSLNMNHKFNTSFSISFGIKEPTYDYILYHIKTVIFKARFKTFTNSSLCLIHLTEKCKSAITKDLQKIYFLAKYKGLVDVFLDTFSSISIQSNIGSLNNDVSIFFKIPII